MTVNKPSKGDVLVDSYKAAPDIDVLTANFPIPGYGLVPINAFVIKGSEPIMVDTGTAVHSESFMPALRRVIELKIRVASRSRS